MELPHVPLDKVEHVLSSNAMLQGECSTWRDYMAATHSMGTVYIPLTEKEYKIVVTHKKIPTADRLKMDYSHVELLPTAMDAYTTAAFLQFPQDLKASYSRDTRSTWSSTRAPGSTRRLAQ